MQLLTHHNRDRDYIGLDMYREWKKIDFPKEYCRCIRKQQDQEVDQETDGKMK
jgi:hypothetical protein